MANTRSNSSYRDVIRGWGPPVAGLAAIALSTLRPGYGIDVAAFALGFLTVAALSTVFHEAAHFAVAAILRREPFYISIGSGQVILQRRWRGITWVIRTNPYGGSVLMNRMDSPAHHFAVIAAGPGIQLILAVLSLYFLKNGIAGHIWAAVPLFQSALVNFASACLNVMPRTVTDSEGTASNDGLQMFRAIRRFLHRAPTSKSRSTQPESAETSPVSGGGLDWSAPNNPVLAQHAAAKLRYELARPALSLESRRQALDQFATTVLMYPSPGELPEADRCSTELLAAWPDVWTVKGTRGSILVELGRFSEGEPLLRECFENSLDAFDREVCAAALAKAAFLQGQTQTASDWISKANQTGNPCPLTQRVTAMITPQPPA